MTHLRPPRTRRRSKLTAPQIETIALAGRGFTNIEIGEHLFLSPDAVRQRLTQVYARLRARDRAHAVALAITDGHLVLHRDGTTTPCYDADKCERTTHTALCVELGWSAPIGTGGAQW